MDIKAGIKSTAAAVGLEGVLRRLYHRSGLSALEHVLKERAFDRAYGAIDRFHVNVRGMELDFCTEESYSRHWFFPRLESGRIHEEPVTLLLMEVLEEAHCFVDVGANIGWYTCVASKRMPEGVVYGFEMDEFNCEILERNLAANGCANVRVVHAAATDEPGRASYLRYAKRPSSNFRLYGAEVWRKDGVAGSSGETVFVDAIRLDHFFRDREDAPDVVKIDVEGAEMLVLRGMTEILDRRPPILFVEVHPEELVDFGSSAEEVIAFLIHRGYRLFEIARSGQTGAEEKLGELDKTTRPDHTLMVYARV